MHTVLLNNNLVNKKTKQKKQLIIQIFTVEIQYSAVYYTMYLADIWQVSIMSLAIVFCHNAHVRIYHR